MIGHDDSLSEVLAEKGSNVYRVEPETIVAEAVALMNLKKIGALLVMRDDHVLGMFTERDVLTRIVGAGRNPRTTRIGEVMTVDLLVVHPSTTVEEAMRIVTERRTRHLPVMEGDHLKGMVSIGDLTRWLVRVDESYIDNLLSYISGKYPG
ncbi:MAG TPA: CBS domain-containing protein [Opitutaceae bacterium]